MLTNRLLFLYANTFVSTAYSSTSTPGPQRIAPTEGWKHFVEATASSFSFVLEKKSLMLDLDPESGLKDGSFFIMCFASLMSFPWLASVACPGHREQALARSCHATGRRLLLLFYCRRWRGEHACEWLGIGIN